MSGTIKKCSCGRELDISDAESETVIKDLMTFGSKTYLVCSCCGTRHPVYGLPLEFLS